MSFGDPNHCILKVSTEGNKITCDWKGEWTDWPELQNSPELQVLLTRASKTLEKSGKGKGKNKPSPAPSGR